MANYLTLQDISFVYNEESHPVWNELSCSFSRHTINLLLGPSGCGKSSLLYLIDGLIPHSLEGRLSGDVRLNGESIIRMEPRLLASRIGLVFQDPDTQFCTFYVEDELAFGMENLCVSPEEMDARIDHVLTLVGLQGLRKRAVSSLSGGQKQKLAIACALIMDAELLLLDEPTAMLDATSRAEIIALLLRLVKEENKTILLVEHNLDELLPHVGHVVVLDRTGSVALQGSAHDVFSQLAFNPAYSRFPVYLPEPLSILRDWLHNEPDERMRAFCQSQLARKQDGAYSLPFEALAGLIGSYAPLPRYAAAVCEAQPAMSSATTQMQANNLSYRYAAKPSQADCGNEVLKGLDFTIRKGEWIAIAGANGAGKTTLLNIIFRVLSGFGGDISISGVALSSVPAQSLYRQMGLLFQNPEWQFVTNCVAEELLFSLKRAPLTDAQKEDAIQRILAQFHLESSRNKSPFLLSQGEKRRLSVACMLLTGQRTLVLDEPTYGQDSENTRELMHLLQSLRKKGVTIVIVTHDMSLVSQYADRLLLLSDGVIAFDGTPADFFCGPLDPAWRVERPPVWRFSQTLQEHLPAFPLFLKTESCINYLNDCSGGEVLRHV
jgi:energy-coupling factor transport system ATP-binding protein